MEVIVKSSEMPRVVILSDSTFVLSEKCKSTIPIIAATTTKKQVMFGSEYIQYKCYNCGSVHCFVTIEPEIVLNCVMCKSKRIVNDKQE